MHWHLAGVDTAGTPVVPFLLFAPFNDISELFLPLVFFPLLPMKKVKRTGENKPASERGVSGLLF